MAKPKKTSENREEPEAESLTMELGKKISIRNIILKKHLEINRPLIPLKIVMFLFYGASTAFLPYTTVHMTQIGLSIEEVAIIYAVLPFTVFVGPPLAGFVADKLGNFKLVLIMSLTLSGVFHTLLLWVDARGEIITPMAHHQENENVSYLWLNSSGAFLGWQPCASNNHCLPWNTTSISTNLGFDLNTCKVLCNKRYAILDFANNDLSHNVQVPLNRSFNWEVQAMLLPNTTDFCQAKLSQIFHEGFVYEKVMTTSSQCSIQCSMPRSRSLCSDAFVLEHMKSKVGVVNKPQPAVTVEFDHVKHRWGFWTYFIERVFATIFLTICFTMLDSATVYLVQKHDGDLGKQRAFAIIGASIASPIAGVLVDTYSVDASNPNYDVTFYFANALFGLTVLVVFFFDAAGEKNDEPMKENLMKLIKYVDVAIYIVVMLLLGNMWGFLESYIFIYLNELSAPPYILGLTVTVGSVVGVPVLYAADLIVEKIGQVNMLVVAFLTYAVRLIGYSLINNYWLALLFEAMEAVTVHLMGVASTSYNADAAPPGLLATLNGVVGAAHYSLGRGSGSFVGGTLMSYFGTKTTFRILGIASAIFGVLYGLGYRLFLAKIERERLENRKEEEIEEAERMSDLSRRSSRSTRASRISLNHVFTDSMLARRMSF